MTTINMQTMRYINLLDKASNVKTRKCFVYNNTIFFAVPKFQISKAIGPDAINVRRINEQIGKKVRVIGEADGIEDAKHFVEQVVAPTKFKALEIKDNMIVLTAGGTQNKASLLGRNKKRFEELKLIIGDIFGLDLRVI